MAPIYQTSIIKHTLWLYSKLIQTYGTLTELEFLVSLSSLKLKLSSYKSSDDINAKEYGPLSGFGYRLILTLGGSKVRRVYDVARER